MKWSRRRMRGNLSPSATSSHQNQDAAQFWKRYSTFFFRLILILSCFTSLIFLCLQAVPPSSKCACTVYIIYVAAYAYLVKYLSPNTRHLDVLPKPIGTSFQLHRPRPVIKCTRDVNLARCWIWPVVRLLTREHGVSISLNQSVNHSLFVQLLK